MDDDRDEPFGTAGRDDDTRGGDMPDDVTEIEALLTELDVSDLALVDVPASVWEAIDAEVNPPPAPVVDISSRRRRVTSWLIAGAAAIVLVVAGIAIVGDRDASDVDVLSTAELTFDPATFDPLGADSTASAELVSRDGELAIRLTDSQLPDLDGEDLELWLIEPDSTGTPIDVAPVAVLGDSDTYALPTGLDPESHFIVDISIEPRDGDVAHSGRSILRGPLEQA